MESYVVIVLVFGALVCFILAVLFFVNRLFLYRSRVEGSFEAVRTCLGERKELFQTMKVFIQNHLEHEEIFDKKIGEIEPLFLERISCVEGIELLKKSDRLFKEIQKLVNVYPEMKKNREFSKFLEAYSLNQDRVEYAMDSYDKGVRDYNQYQDNRFMKFLAKLFHFPEYPYYN